LAISEQGTPLGTIHSLSYTRDDEAPPPQKNRRQLLIEEKESYRWLVGFLKSCEIAEECPDTTIVSISDREGDVFDIFEEAKAPDTPHNAHVIIRERHNRFLENAAEKGQRIEQKLTRSSVIYNAQIVLNPDSKKERKANIAIRAAPVCLKIPVNSVKKRTEPVQVNAVMISEFDPPKDCEALYWVLITTLPIKTEDQVRKIVMLYGLRWHIELFFKCLKSGCKIDSLLFQSVERIENYIALCLIIAWKTMLVTYLPR
ncbi:MAG: IS4 transposase, partial [Halioglobus sp.]